MCGRSEEFQVDFVFYRFQDTAGLDQIGDLFQFLEHFDILVVGNEIIGLTDRIIGGLGTGTQFEAFSFPQIDGLAGSQDFRGHHPPPRSESPSSSR